MFSSFHNNLLKFIRLNKSIFIFIEIMKSLSNSFAC